jgi:Hydroxyacylglutathione hydrolase C-terminus
LQEELQYNVFLRCSSSEMMGKLGASNGVSALKILRERKDNMTWAGAIMSGVLRILKFIPPLARRFGVDR